MAMLGPWFACVKELDVIVWDAASIVVNGFAVAVCRVGAGPADPVIDVRLGSPDTAALLCSPINLSDRSMSMSIDCLAGFLAGFARVSNTSRVSGTPRVPYTYRFSETSA
jgi:hypothetical protein